MQTRAVICIHIANMCSQMYMYCKNVQLCVYMLQLRAVICTYTYCKHANLFVYILQTRAVICMCIAKCAVNCTIYKLRTCAVIYIWKDMQLQYLHTCWKPVPSMLDVLQTRAVILNWLQTHCKHVLSFWTCCAIIFIANTCIHFY